MSAQGLTGEQLDALSETIYRNEYTGPASDCIQPLAERHAWEQEVVARQVAAVEAWYRANVLHPLWAKAYRLGIEDERISEANIGIAGCLCNSSPCRCKIEPTRANPYGRN
ncbi:hypothetical protein [Arthrobacter sp. A2-55]|uniref:hypothetical protein n=1 Tax=Arthrobacter sp. A2-55 TaxID=2897337 RepID=UPI0021CDC772|nr:hypothetical protein [Arthrobacter sp. A2-55]MCU6480510.1 hypothetical protein [Arthrobacter sp. A2-55]